METQKSQAQTPLSLPSTYSHQPYLVKFKDELCLLFCYEFNSINAIYGDSLYSYTPWKLAYSRLDQLTLNAIETGFAQYDIHCSPVASTNENGQLFLSFIGGVQDEEGAIFYHLYGMEGYNLNDLSRPDKLHQEYTFAGFQNDKYQVRNWREPETEITNLASKKTVTVYFSFVDSVQRIAPVPGQEDAILITGTKTLEPGKYCTFIYGINDTSIREVKVNNESIYKSCIYENKLIYARQVGDFEQRQLFSSEGYELCPVL
jgi:hypothetical protein